ncbi:Y-family DNA polymerase [Novosphingobium bradum]|uniref:Y-family DNA polymerase n=1 Tax=Novosphingobium bradum TaxID=1737444 RepID=A0ABV7ISP9_9SPHN
MQAGCKAGARPEQAPCASPFALVARSGSALRLAAVDPAAQKAGLAAGMALADARARCPDLVTRPADPAADAAALERLLGALGRFTPVVAADPPDGAVLDVTGCAHLLGGEAGLLGAVLEEARRAGHAARPAFAANPAAARALARHGASDVRALPVAALELPDESLMALRRAGLATLGDLAARPSSALAARFGEGLVLRLRQVLGEAASPLVPRRHADPLRAEERFAEPVARTEDVLDVAEDLLRRLGAEMERRRLGGRRFVFTLCRSDGARRRLAVETGLASRDPAPVMRLLRERIEGLADPLDPGFGFDSVVLAIPRSEPLAARQAGLGQIGAQPGGDAVEDSVAALVDRLVVRLGPEAVYRLVPADRHLPEVAQEVRPWGQGLPRRQATFAARLDDSPPRPLVLFDPPQPIEVIAGVPDGPPLRFRWRGALFAVRLAEGPERIAAEWWRHEGAHSGQAATNAATGALTRDYYRVEDAQGRRWWLFRHGLHAEKPHPAWYLHGQFP